MFYFLQIYTKYTHPYRLTRKKCCFIRKPPKNVRKTPKLSRRKYLSLCRKSQTTHLYCELRVFVCMALIINNRTISNS